MAISVGNSTYTAQDNANSITVSAPSGIEDGDVLVLRVTAWDTISGLSWPSGFSGVSTTYDAAAVKEASSESGSYEVTVSSGGLMVATLTVIKGADVSSKVWSNTDYTTNNTTLRAAGITVGAGACLVWMAGIYLNGTITNPSGFTTQVGTGDAYYGDIRLQTATKLGLSSGATGDIDGTMSAATTYKHVIMLGLDPAAEASTFCPRVVLL